jgi:hypothetical protein
MITEPRGGGPSDLGAQGSRLSPDPALRRRLGIATGGGGGDGLNGVGVP